MKSASIALLLFAAAACKSDRDTQPRSHADPRADLTGKTPLHMRNCPSAVPTAKTVATPTSTGIDVAITSEDPLARTKIFALAAIQADEGGTDLFAREHSGRHGGPGTIGHCPIIHANTQVTYEPNPDGVTLHVMARAPGDVARLQQATEARVAALIPPSS